MRGATLSGIAVEGLERASGIASRTLASLEFAWKEGRDLLSDRDVLVVDEAGLVGSRQMERVLSHAQAAGAKVVLIGDPEQLQAIEAGAAFRVLADRHGAAEISEVRRQREVWQRTATRELATERTAHALGHYADAGIRRPASSLLPQPGVRIRKIAASPETPSLPPAPQTGMSLHKLDGARK